MTAPISVWASLAAPFPNSAVEWRQVSKMFLRDGKPFGRFVACVGANAARARLDETVAGDWTIALELLPISADADGVYGRELERREVRTVQEQGDAVIELRDLLDLLDPLQGARPFGLVDA